MLLKFAFILALVIVASCSVDDEQVITTRHRGIIRVKGTNVDGYVSSGRASEFNPFQYTDIMSNALGVIMNVDGMSPVDIVAINSPSNSNPPRYCFGAMIGYGSSSPDLGPGSDNYQVLMATPPTTPGGPPSELPSKIPANRFAIESAIWFYSPKDNSIRAQYINRDLKEPTTYIGLWTDMKNMNSGESFILTGDKSTFEKTYGKTTWVDFSLLF